MIDSMMIKATKSISKMNNAPLNIGFPCDWRGMAMSGATGWGMIIGHL
ncbi:hypothetical protein UE99_033240 [Burkholderia cenocepacia]|nr:hypothetical protein [Burkholderia cenocepacia]